MINHVPGTSRQPHPSRLSTPVRMKGYVRLIVSFKIQGLPPYFLSKLSSPRNYSIFRYHTGNINSLPQSQKMADSTPLLADFDDNDTPHIDTNNEEFETQAGVPNDPAPASSHFKRPIKILTIIILVCSIITVALLIANDIIVTYGPFPTYRWYIYDALNSTIGLGIFVRTPFFPSLNPISSSPPPFRTSL